MDLIICCVWDNIEDSIENRGWNTIDVDDAFVVSCSSEAANERGWMNEEILRQNTHHNSFARNAVMLRVIMMLDRRSLY